MPKIGTPWTLLTGLVPHSKVATHPKEQRDIDHVAKAVSGLTGVDAVLTRSEAARQFHFLASRIGDLAVLADKQTVFGDLDTESEALPAEYRSHGSMYERDVPFGSLQRRSKALSQRLSVQPGPHALALSHVLLKTDCS
jgi:hypothetical protein